MQCFCIRLTRANENGANELAITTPKTSWIKYSVKKISIKKPLVMKTERRRCVND